MVTEHFNAALAGLGITVTQIPVLAVLRVLGEASLSRLAELLVLDTSTLSRNLLVLQKRGLVELAPGTDRRTRIVQLSPLGLGKLAEAYPVWLEAQRSISERLGSDEYASTLELMRRFRGSSPSP